MLARQPAAGTNLRLIARRDGDGEPAGNHPDLQRTESDGLGDRRMQIHARGMLGVIVRNRGEIREALDAHGNAIGNHH